MINEGWSAGDQVVRCPITGNDTVLDAISNVGGLKNLATKRIWIARPAANGQGNDAVLPVNWTGITRGGKTAMNYQVLPGDRIFITDPPKKPARY